MSCVASYLPLLLRVLEEHGDALPPADAGAPDGVLLALPNELVGEVREDASSRGAERVAQGDGAAVGVGDGAVEAELLLAGEVLGREEGSARTAY